MSFGKIIQVIGPVVDVDFPSESLPQIYNAVLIRTEDQPEEYKKLDVNLTLETLQHLGDGRVRCVAMDSPMKCRGVWWPDTGIHM